MASTTDPAVAVTKNTVRAVAAGVAVVASIGYTLYRHWDTPIFSSPRLTQKLRQFGSIPILGDGLNVLLNLNRLHDYVTECLDQQEKEGDKSSIAIKLPFQPPIVLVSTVEAVEHILKTKFPIYDKGEFMHSRMVDTFDNGIFATDGDTWKHQRKTAANIFNIKNFKEFAGGAFVDEMVIFEQRLMEVANTNQVFDLQDLFFRFTLDGFSKIAFGAELGCLKSKTPVPFAVAFDDAQGVVMKRFLTPLWFLQEALNGTMFRQSRNVKVIKKFCLDIIDKRMQELESGTADISGHDLLAFLMASTEPTTGKRPNRENLCTYVINFIIAGRDTTAQALSWTFLMLHRNPRVVDVLLEEIRATVSESGDENAYVTYEQIKGMKYANAVFHEALRLYPSVPMESKQANTSDVLPDGTLVPKGALVSWSLYAMGRSESVWGPDAKEFRPERWLEMDKQPSPFKYNVFNAGPRVCLGKNLAELEGVFVLVELIRRFKFEIINHERVTYAPSLTLPLLGGLKAKVSLRK